MRVSVVFKLASCLVALFAPSVINAAKIETKEYDGINFVIISGEISLDDDKRFNRIAAVFDDAVVLLDSNGGATISALKIGESIRLKGYSTYVSDSNTCVSACALIWLAGSPRMLDEGASVGFHATYTDTDGRKLESGYGNALVGRYLTLLNLPEKTVLFATSASPENLNSLTARNYSGLGIDVKVIKATPESDPVIESVPPPVVRTVSTPPPAKLASPQVSLWKNVGLWTIRVDHTLNEGCFALSDYGKYGFRVGFEQADTLVSYALLAGTEWKSLKENEKYQLSLTFDGETPWTGNATGIKLGNIVGLRMNISDDKFWQEFVKSQSLRVDYDGSFLVNLRIKGSKNAFDEIIKCQKSQIISRRKTDPFDK
ncbi:hypothetical protein GGR91_000549 [Sphingorhabdus rigui]|uniref:Uncharacterized protein n=1 Tax=Sphingorhabdus rigui TaxID=1282858 RepID=A0A840AZA2_9SPHN|nr:hypothetical protein [Sphingorhabdus rigui]MBB3942327.1 hypothetical protein [Sphingorhabdus rigui]